MQLLDDQLVHSASDLNAYSECSHLGTLEYAAIAGRANRPQRDNPTAELLARKGELHERRYLEHQRRLLGTDVIALTGRPEPSLAGYAAAEDATTAAMASGAALIYQAAFFDGMFVGRADFLRRVERKSARWAWSYEVVETKLALAVKPHFLIQLCHYSEHVERIQGTPPQAASIVLGNGQNSMMTLADYTAYYRRLKLEYLRGVGRTDGAYPLECAFCDMCVWQAVCAQKRDSDDHLSLVAGMRRDQIGKLNAAGISTLRELATASTDVRPKHLSMQTFANLGAQASEQQKFRAARDAGENARHSYSFRECADEISGLARLPEPDAGDIFFDMEGDPMYAPGRALEYLFGVYLPAERMYRPFWGTTPAAERRAFEEFIDFVLERQERYPRLHVYHYAPYEMSALKRLMGRFGSREAAVDGFLRGQTFVDLYPVVTQSIRISQPSYSIKKLEPLYDFRRATHTLTGDHSIVMFERWLETQDAATLEDIRAYNEDDCRSTFGLREWLVRLRAERSAQLGRPLAWRDAPAESEPTPDVERSDLELELLAKLATPDSVAELRSWSEAARARWLLGQLLQYHRREQKPAWWEHFARLDGATDLIEGDHKALGGLEFQPDIPTYKRNPRDQTLVYTYRYPEQEFDLKDSPLDAASGKSAGEVVATDDITGTLQIKLARSVRPERLQALIPGRPLDDSGKREAIEAIARAYRDDTLAANAPATLDLLLGRPPRLTDRPAGARLQPNCVTHAAVSQVVQALDRSYLVLQGPPGSGKSTIGAQIIVDLIRAGKRVAIAAQSHKALHGLLHKVEETAAQAGLPLRGCHKSTAKNPETWFESVRNPASVCSAPKFAQSAGCQLVSATTFAWAADATQRGMYDFVFIDEAGQVSLADALATSLVAASVVLLGDPQQLPQVVQGFHPAGVDRSILEHVIGERATIERERGIFLDTSYRMQPEIDGFISRTFYDGRLIADSANANNRVTSHGRVLAGPRSLSVPHEHNARRSSEEADAIVGAVAGLLADGTVTIRDQPTRRLEATDILIVTPYNMQRLEIAKRLEMQGIRNVRVGTVDKFQGQEAPIVFYSMTVSSAELAPRGIDFLLSPHRLNVALSRAQALCVLVCSPLLLASAASTIEQMRLLNSLCAYVECAPSYEARSEPGPKAA